MLDPDFHGVRNVELLRKRAKELLRSARRSEAAAISRLRASVGRLEHLPPGDLITTVKLADAQHAVAREQGAASWPKLLAAIAEQAPPAAQAARLLAAVRAGDPAAAERVVGRWPAIGDANVWCACAAGRTARLAEILAADPPAALAPHAKDGWTPILYAAASPLYQLTPELSQGLRGCVAQLLAAGADPNAFTLFETDDPQSKLPALFWACSVGNATVARLLLEHGAHPNDGESVYHAAERDHRDCLQVLLDHGADLSGRQAPYGNTPLNFLAGYREMSDSYATAERGMRWLLEHGADPNVTAYDIAETPLHRFAASGRSRAAIEMLLAHGAEVDKPRADGRTAYALAVHSGNSAAAQLLLEHGADPSRLEITDELMGACRRGDEAAARAVLARQPALFELLAPADRGALADAAEQSNEAAIRVMIKLGFDLAAERPGGGTALHAAAWAGLPAMVRLLIGLGAPLELRDSQFGCSALGWAAHGSGNCRRADDDYCAVTELLIDAGASRAAAMNRWGGTPEDMASRRVAALLRRRGLAPPLRAVKPSTRAT